MDLQNQARKLVRIVADKTVFLEHVSAYQLIEVNSLRRFNRGRMKLAGEPASRDRFEFDLSRAVGDVLLSEFSADWGSINDDVIEV